MTIKNTDHSKAHSNRPSSSCLISGAGATAELMAAALGSKKIPHSLIAPTQQPTEQKEQKEQKKFHLAPTQARTVAIWRGGLKLLETIFQQQDLLKLGYPICGMALIDEKKHESFYFPEDAGIDDDYFGYNIPLNALTHFTSQYNDHSGFTHRVNAETKILKSPGCIITNDQQAFNGELLIVAEGKDSRTAQQAGVTPIVFSQQNVAVVSVVKHQIPHNQMAREYHLKPGPLAFVPLAENYSSLVWTCQKNNKTTDLINDNQATIDALNHASYHQLEIVEITEPLVQIPLTSRQTTVFRAERMALIGESAHKMPPTGAQGMNLTLRDIAELADLIETTYFDQGDIGNQKLLKTYSGQRLKDSLATSAAVHLGNLSIRHDGALGMLRRKLQQSLLPQFPKMQSYLINRALYGF